MRLGVDFREGGTKNKGLQIDVTRVRKYKEEYILSYNVLSRIRSVDNEINPS
jgi:hypothetical protein